MQIFSGKDHPIAGARALFLCYRLPAQHGDDKEWSVTNGNTAWYLHDLATGEIIEDPYEIDDIIASDPETPRQVKEEPETLIEARKAVDKHIHQTYMRKAQVPSSDNLGNPINPVLMAWLELA